MSIKGTIYFPNLNGLRIVAAAMIFFPHIEQMKGLLGLPVNQTINNFHIAKQGLILFFVLSGFLVTYLLMEEKRGKGIISVRHFT
jgi:peptidoglycan/LPS O-acetylase OafA/YrhL